MPSGETQVYILVRKIMAFYFAEKWEDLLQSKKIANN